MVLSSIVSDSLIHIFAVILSHLMSQSVVFQSNYMPVIVEMFSIETDFFNRILFLDEILGAKYKNNVRIIGKKVSKVITFYLKPDFYQNLLTFFQSKL